MAARRSRDLFAALVRWLHRCESRAALRAADDSARSTLWRSCRVNGGYRNPGTPPDAKNDERLGQLAFIGFLIQTVYSGTPYLAFINGVAAGTAALVMSLRPILVTIVAMRWSREKTTKAGWVGLCLGLAVTTVVIISRAGIETPPLIGLLLAFLGLGGIALAARWEKRFRLSYDPVKSNLIGYAAGLLRVLPIMIVMDGGTVEWTSVFIAALAYLVVGNSVIVIRLLLMMIRSGEVAKVSALFFLIPPGCPHRMGRTR